MGRGVGINTSPPVWVMQQLSLVLLVSGSVCTLCVYSRARLVVGMSERWLIVKREDVRECQQSKRRLSKDRAEYLLLFVMHRGKRKLIVHNYTTTNMKRTRPRTPFKVSLKRAALLPTLTAASDKPLQREAGGGRRLRSVADQWQSGGCHL